jgi:uroporphyrinogen III methyltransferase / synthase
MLMNISRTEHQQPLVYLVGAGPGNPGLVTLRAVECLGRAELVLYDRLVPSRLLTLAPADADKVCVTDFPGSHPERCPQVLERMLAEARRGRCVVRLKGGDPLVFGRGGEEAEALSREGIPFEIVPGITAALGAGAYAGIPLTHRNCASAVALVTGHEDPDKPDTLLDWAALAHFPGTLIFYMGVSRLEKLAATLIEHGKDPQTPAALVQEATLGRQRTVTAPLRDLPQAGQAAGIAAPAVTIVGPVVALRQQVGWFEHRPLFGKRVLVTRPAHQAEDLVHRLEELGAIPLVLPAVILQEPDDWGPVDEALDHLAQYQWLVFTSVNGVHAFIRRLRHTGRDLRTLGGLRLAAIGPATADALRCYHLEPDLVPEEYRSEELVRLLREQVVGQRVLLARADRGRELLREELASVAHVDQVAVYAQRDASATFTGDPAVLDLLNRGEVDYITLTSSNIASALSRLLGKGGQSAIREGRTRLVTISPVTSGRVRDLGWSVAAEATVYTMDGMVDALVRLAQSTTGE